MNRILILIIINLIFFLRTLWYGFVSDDCYALDVAKIVPKNKLHSFWLHIRGQKYTSGKLAHSLNIIVHTINCILIYLAFGRNGLSFLAALLFAVNPINTQGGSIWLSGRCYAIATMFSLLMFLMPLASPLFYFIANYFSFGAIISLFFFIPTKYWMMIFFMPLIFLVMRKKMLATRLEIKSTTATKTMKELRPYKLILFFKTFGYYTQLAIWPLRLGLYHPCLYLWGVSKQDNEDCLEIDWGFWKGLILAGLWLVLTVFNWGNPLGFGLFWWGVGILPWLNIITIQQSVAERYIYLGNCGLMLALSYMIRLLPQPFNYMVFAFIFGFYCIKLWLYTSAYKDELHFARHNLYDFPDFYHVYSWLGLIYKDMGRRYEAVGCWADALELRPLDFKTLFNTAHVLGELGHLQAAYDVLEKAKKCLIPDMVEEEMLKIINNRQKHIKNAIEKSQIQAQNQIIDMAKEIKKGKKVI